VGIFRSGDGTALFQTTVSAQAAGEIFLETPLGDCSAQIGQAGTIAAFARAFDQRNHRDSNTVAVTACGTANV
jgi:hypothetical protein